MIVQVVRLAPGRLLLVGPAGEDVRLEALVARRLPAGSRTVVMDTTAAYAILDLIGPAVGRGLAEAGLRRRQGPDGHAACIDIGLADAHLVSGGEHGIACTRLILASDRAVHVNETLLSCGVLPIGAWSLRALRIEAGLPAWGVEVDPTMTPAEAGLEALAGRPASAGSAILAKVQLTERGPLLIGREPVRHANKLVGWMLSASFGSADGRSGGIAYMSEGAHRALDALDIDVDIAGERHHGVLRQFESST
jgi:glycine cleavage system aminomethyltransferase T